MLDVRGRDDHGFVMGFDGVLVESGGGLGAEVAVLDVEVKRADAVRAADASELHASLDPRGSVVPHGPIVVVARDKVAHGGWVAKVMQPKTGQPRRLAPSR